MSLTQDEHAWLRRIEDKIDKIMFDGCAKSHMHQDHENRLRAMRTEMDEGHGRETVRQSLIATGISVACVFLGRLWK